MNMALLKILRMIKKESAARMRVRINRSIRQYNQEGIATNWRYQAENKLY